MSKTKYLINQRIIPITKGLVFGVCFTLLVMATIEQQHHQMDQRLSVAVQSQTLTTEVSRYEQHD